MNRSTSVREVRESTETGAVESQAALSFLFSLVASNLRGWAVRGFEGARRVGEKTQEHDDYWPASSPTRCS